MRHDPMGLSYDPFSMVDDYIATDVGSKAAFMERLVGGAQVATYVGLTVMSMLPFPITGIAADIGASVLESNMPPELVAARKAMGVVALGALAATVGKIGYNASKYAIQYVAKYGMRGTLKNLYNGGKSLAGKALNWIRKAVSGSCGCFTAGTLVWSAAGPVPIEEIKKHDWVYAQNVDTGEAELREVTDVIVIPNAAGLDVVISHLDGETETISTTDEHPFWIEADTCAGAKGEWKRADTLKEGDVVRTLKGVAVVERTIFGTHRETVYNFTVEGLNNYRVGANGLLVHNADCSWTAAREAYWKAKGYAGPPQALVKVRNLKTGAETEKVVSKELHHINGRNIENPHDSSNLQEVWPWEHEAADEFRKTGYEVVDIIRSWIRR